MRFVKITVPFLSLFLWLSCDNDIPKNKIDQEVVVSKIQLNPLEYNLQNLEKDSLIRFLKSLVDSNQKFDLASQIQLAFTLGEFELEIPSSFFHPDVHLIYEITSIGNHLKLGDPLQLLNVLKKSTICEQYPQICYLFEIRFEQNFSIECHNYLARKNYHPKNFTEIFLLTKLLGRVGFEIYLVGKELSLSSVFFSYHFLEKNRILDQCPRLISEISLDLLLSLSNHEIDFSSLKAHLYLMFKKQLTSLNELEKLKLVEWELNKLNGVELNWIKTAELDNVTKRYLATDIAFEKWEKDPESAARYLEFAISLSPKNPCDLLLSVMYNYQLLIYIEIGDVNKIQEIINELNDFKDCIGENLIHRRFQNINYQSEGLIFLDPNYDRAKLIDSLYIHRSLGDELFKDQPDHLGDFYARNAIKIFGYLSELNELSPKYKSLALELMQNTKQRELQRIRKISEDEVASESDQRLKELLNEIDYFNKPKDYSDPIYPEIFQRALQAHINHAKVVAESPPVTKDYSQYVSSTDEKAQTLNFINSIGVYVGYLYNNKGLQIFEWDQSVVDSLAGSLHEKILEKESYAAEVKELQHILFESLVVDTSMGVSIIPDGPLASFPFELVLDQEVSYNYELKTEEPEKIFIDKNQTTLLSYSNEETILKEMEEQEKSMVRSTTAKVDRSDYVELTYGYIECNSINQLFGDKPDLYVGGQANKENFFDAFDQDLLHISAHAYSNAESKYDNYIILRKANLAQEHIYSYEIETHGPSPKVVILSACQTGVGAFTEGVGTYSISRAFITNGSEAVIKTLWKINDLTTKEFMVQMYKHWLTGISLKEALILTKSDFKKNDRYTAYDWAGFILEGNGNIYLEL